MKCWSCGAEVPEGRTSCPDCAAYLSSPKPDKPIVKEKRSNKYRRSIRMLRRLCIVEWLWFFLAGFAPILAEVTSLFDVFWQENTPRQLIMFLILAGTAGLLAVELLTFKAMKRYEDSFSRVMAARIAVFAIPVLLESALVENAGLAGFFVGSILGFIYLMTLPLLFVIGIVSAYYDYSFCSALSSYIEELSSKQSKRLDNWGVLLPILSVITLGPRIVSFFLVTSTEPDADRLIVFLMINAALMGVIPVLMTWTYRICRTELKN